jgi:hypothetical protein
MRDEPLVRGVEPTLAPAQAPRPGRGVLRHFIVSLVAILGACGLYLAHEHYSVAHDTTHSLLALGGAALLAFVPLRSIIGAAFRLESKVMHALHGIGALALAALFSSGVIPGGSVLTHASLAPFAIMGAAQAVMHQNHPRNARQAQALRRFAASLPEVEQFTRGSLASPQNAVRAVVVLQDLIGKAEALGYTELDADPGFQGALRQTTTRVGLTLALDQMQKAVTTLAANPTTAGAVPELEARLAKARRVAGGERR